MKRINFLLLAIILLISGQVLAQTGSATAITSTSTPDLGEILTREMGMAKLVKELGKEAEAKAMSEADIAATLQPYKDAQEVTADCRPFVAYSLKKKLIDGIAADLIGPKLAMNSKAYATMIMRGMSGISGMNDSPATNQGGLSSMDAAKFAQQELIIDDQVGLSLGSLSSEMVSREDAMADLVKTLGKEAEAKAMSEADITTTLKPYKDASDIRAEVRPYVAYVLKNQWAEGASADQLQPKATVDAATTARWTAKAQSGGK